MAVRGRRTTKNSNTSPQKVQIALRRQMALELRLQGGSYKLIAETMLGQPGVSPKYNEGAAYTDVNTELDRVKGHMLDMAERIKTRQLLQIQELWAGIYPFAKQGDLASLDRCVKLLHYEAELLGLFPKEEKKAPRGAGGGVIEPGESGATLSIREVVVQLNGIDPTLASDMIDVTPVPQLEEAHGNRSGVESVQ